MSLLLCAVAVVGDVDFAVVVAVAVAVAVAVDVDVVVAIDFAAFGTSVIGSCFAVFFGACCQHFPP